MSERSKSVTCWCNYCKKEFRASRQDARFCSANCRKRYNRIKHNIAQCATIAVSQIAEMRRLTDKLREDEQVVLDLEIDRIREYLQAGNVTAASDTDSGERWKRDALRWDGLTDGSVTRAAVTDIAAGETR